ncbi:hypothetical protein QBC46DRAFT_231986, partial [Diplogelasinospora grovesii]
VRPCMPAPGDRDALHSVQERRIEFRHPAYPDSAPPLLSLAAVDGERFGAGIEYSVAFAACGIVAGNRWEGAWFGQKDRIDGTDCISRVVRPVDGILRGSMYYFCIGPNTLDRYAVVQSFEHWRFPHHNLPPVWRDLAIKQPLVVPNDPDRCFSAVVCRDRSCRITGCAEACKAFRLIPPNAGEWFTSNSMDRYSRFPEPGNTDDDRNMILLRRDLHHLLDKRRCAIVPKMAAAASPLCGPTLVTHLLLPQRKRELHDLYHNRALQHPVTGIAVEALFARFAWAVMCPETFPFLTGNTDGFRVMSFDTKTKKL